MLSPNAQRKTQSRRAPSEPVAQVAELIAENAQLKLLLEQAQSRAQVIELPRYAPKIEARRADYERLGDCLHFMTVLEADRAPSILEVDSIYEESRGVLLNAFWAHLHALTCETLEWFDLRTFRKFYAEMRLWVDQLEYERQQQYPEK